MFSSLSVDWLAKAEESTKFILLQFGARDTDTKLFSRQVHSYYHYYIYIFYLLYTSDFVATTTWCCTADWVFYYLCRLLLMAICRNNSNSTALMMMMRMAAGPKEIVGSVINNILKNWITMRLANYDKPEMHNNQKWRFVCDNCIIEKRMMTLDGRPIRVLKNCIPIFAICQQQNIGMKWNMPFFLFIMTRAYFKLASIQGYTYQQQKHKFLLNQKI